MPVFAELSVSVPSMELKPEDLKKIKDKAMEMLAERIRARGKDPSEYIIRDILPATDLGFATEEWAYTPTTANAWNKMVDGVQLPEDKFLVIFGFANLSASPKITAIKIYKGAIPARVVQVERGYANVENPIVLFQPIVIDEREKVTVEVYATATEAQKPILLGFVAEKLGTTIGQK